MKKITKYDLYLLRKKIDQTLTPDEEEHFDHLMKTSPEAVEFYRKEAIIDHALKYDSGKIPEIDLSGRIMEITERGFAVPSENKGRIRHLPAIGRQQLLLYAAVLMIGIITGSLAVYLATSPKKITNEESVSGTIAGSYGKKFLYREGGTGINVQGYSSGEFRMLIAEVETTDDILCTFNKGDSNSFAPDINLLFSSGDFQTVKQDNGEESYLCRGRNIFLLKNTDRLDGGSVNFTRNGKLIFQYKTGE